MQQRQRELERFQRDIDYYQAHQEQLLTQYPDQWVAIYNEKLVGASADAEQLFDDLKEQGIPVGRALFEYVTRKEELLILPA